MVYLWRMKLNGQWCTVKAGKLHTALHKLTDGENLKTGKIEFQRLQKVSRVRCETCDNSYEDNPESKKHHMEVYYWHQQALEKQKESKLSNV